MPDNWALADKMIEEIGTMDEVKKEFMGARLWYREEKKTLDRTKSQFEERKRIDKEDNDWLLEEEIEINSKDPGAKLRELEWEERIREREL